MTDGEINNPARGAGENGMAQQTPESSEAKHRHSGLSLDELTAEIAKQKSVLASSQTKRSPALFVFGRHILGSIAVLLVISYVCFVALGPTGLLISPGADLEAEYDNSTTPLVRAIARGDYHIIKFILDHGADVNAGDEIGGTALHYAVHRGQTAVLELLIAKGANINAVTTYNKTPLDYAEKESRADIVALLRKHGGKTGKELKEEKNE